MTKKLYVLEGNSWTYRNGKYHTGQNRGFLNFCGIPFSDMALALLYTSLKAAKRDANGFLPEVRKAMRLEIVELQTITEEIRRIKIT